MEVRIDLPSAPVAVVDLPAASTLLIDPLTPPVSVLPAGFIPMVPERTLFTASGSGAAVVAAAVRLTAVAAGSGATTVRPSPRITAASSGSGAASVPAYVVGQAFPTTIEASGAGSATVTAAAGSAVAAGAAGLASVRPTVVVLAAASGLGSGTVSPGVVVRGAATGAGAATVAAAVRVVAAASGSGAATVAAMTAVWDQGITKSGTQQIPASLTASNPAQITGWIVDSAYPESAVESDGLRVPASGGSVKVSATMKMSVLMTSAHSRGLHIYSNGVKVAEQTISGFTTDFAVEVTLPATAQLITIRAHATASNAGNRNVTEATIRVERA